MRAASHSSSTRTTARRRYQRAWQSCAAACWRASRRAVHWRAARVARQPGAWDRELRQANLRQAILRQATLRQAIPRQANLRQAILRQATLRQAIPRQATLRRASLRRASPRQAVSSSPAWIADWWVRFAAQVHHGPRLHRARAALRQ
ncbi:pentapeptide repeat-containing protein [Achromobacter kerstersii]|uniref:pentapeptide repeat-containing protein n=1 Tax=Achromobacter kerstersii TaxID=1353890 RepID=UPI003D1806BB